MRLLPVPEPLQLVGLGGRERWREGQRVSIWGQPLWQQEGRGCSDRKAQVSFREEKGRMPTLRSSVEGWGDTVPHIHSESEVPDSSTQGETGWAQMGAGV